MKKTVLNIVKGIALFTLCIIIAVSALTEVYSIPTDRIKGNVTESAQIFNDEGEYPQVYSWCKSKLDNVTDGLMLLIAEHENGDSALKDAMEVKWNLIEGKSASVSLVYNSIWDIDYTKTDKYSRYWHGYLVYLKPLLTVFNYGQIRIINTVVLILLIAVLFLILFFKNKKELILPFLITILIAAPTVIFKSLQFTHCFSMIIISSIFMLLIEKSKNFNTNALYLLLLTGISTAFFDLLTYPIATYCIPAALYLFITKKENFKDVFLKVIKTGVSWALGYFGFWASKWVVGSLILRENIMTNAIESVQIRTSSSGIEAFFSNIGKNVSDFVSTPFIFLAAAFLLFVIIKTFIGKTGNKTDFNTFVIPYVIVAIVPFAWYVVLQNHSLYHHFFTHKALLGCVFALMIMAVDLYKNHSKVLIKE